MPGIIPGSGIQSINDQTERAQFANAVAKQTGLDPRVISAWAQEETGGHPYGGYHNWLNLRPYAGDPYSGVSPGNFEEFSNMQDAVAATVRRLNQPFAKPIIQSAGQTPASQIAAIASTGWDAGHYGGQGGPRLLSVFDSLYGHAAEGKAAPGDLQVNPAGGAGTGVLGSQGAVGGVFSGISDAFNFVTSWRFVEVIGGFLLLLVGLYLLGRQFGVPNALGFTPAGELAKNAADNLPGSVSRQNAREYRRGSREGRLSASRSAGRAAGASTISRPPRSKKVTTISRPGPGADELGRRRAKRAATGGGGDDIPF